jgi:Leucine-rich repeat (LRR) protein
VYTIPSLHYLYLGYNQLTGYIGEFQHNTLVSLSLSNNKLHGSLLMSISKLVRLRGLYISFNNLSGNVESKMFSNLKSLAYLDLSHNRLLSWNTFTNAIDILPKLLYLDLSSSNLSEIPHFLRTAEYLGRLDLSNNQIKGNIPTWLLEVGKESLYYLNLSYNFLTSIRHLPWKNLMILDLHFNLLQGPLPVPPLDSSFFSVSRNKLTGEIPSLICNLNSLEYLDLSFNHLSNMIPPCLGNLSDSLIDLNLRSNNLNGTISKKFSKGNNLRSLKLNGNQLEGSLPRSLINCRKLEVLDLGHNKINGTFPRWC